MRTLNDEVLYAWMINYIYDGSKDLKKIDRIRAYQVSSTALPHSLTSLTYSHIHSLTHSLTHPQVSSILTTYKWLDFFVYMNILFSQIDMLVIEIMSELGTSLLTHSPTYSLTYLLTHSLTHLLPFLVVNYFSTTFFLNAHEFFEDNEQLKETEMNALHNNAPFNGIQRISVMPGAVVTQG